MKLILTGLIFGTLLCPATSVFADQPYPFVQSISTPGLGNDTASIFILPDGSGPALTEARLLGQGISVDATIVLILITVEGDPISNFPREDVWLDAQDEQQFFCPQGFCADNNSTVNGEMVFSTFLAGGGWHNAPTYVYVNGNPAYDPTDYPWYWAHPPVNLHFNSADISGDGLVDLVDVGFFAENFFNEYHYRSDLFCDGVLNLIDVGRLASGLGTNCP